jgi:predicted nucleic acid-binding Zn finger protein
MNEFDDKTDSFNVGELDVQKISPSKGNNIASSNEEKFLKALHFILTDNLKLLENALDIVEDDYYKIKLYKSLSSNRIFWVIPGSGRGKDYKEYVCINNYCSCASYYEQAKNTVDPIICKHILAVKIASVLQMYISTPVSDDVFIPLLTNQFNTESKNNENIIFNPPSNFPRF